MKELSDGNYRELIQHGITMVDFYAPWCMPCMRMENHVEDFSSKNPDINVYKYNVDKGIDIWNKIREEFNIRSIPFVVIYQNGEVVASDVGYKNSESLQKMLDNIN
jgi:thioredoxin 1|tara:strand:+ start:1677 stop:1994 length:318 start_codon:yes stop_codon:yes gene_type:complete